MELVTVLKILTLLIGFYMAWNIGANDVSNAMGTSVGSGALTLRRAVILAAILEFSGAYFVGANVSETMQHGLIDTSLFITQPLVLILGMLGALLGTGVWLQVASYFGLPVSTTHAIVGAIIGFGWAIGGTNGVQWSETIAIISSWIISPVLSGIFSFMLFSILQKKILFALDPSEATRKLLPPLVFIVLFTFTLSVLFNGLQNLHLEISFVTAMAAAIAMGLVGGLIAYFVVRRMALPHLVSPSRYRPQTVISLEKAMKHLQRVHLASFDEMHDKVGHVLAEVKDLSDTLKTETRFSERASDYQSVERMFVFLQILSACYVAFAHGANDVANAIGPVSAVLDIIDKGVVSELSPIPSWLLAFGGLGIVIGLATWGWRVIETIGKKITELTPTRGFSAEFGAATTILIASKLGMPISTTHCLVGSVLGVGLARGMRAINLTMIRDIILTWVITIPASAVMSISAFYLLKAIFLKGSA